MAFLSSSPVRPADTHARQWSNSLFDAAPRAGTSLAPGHVDQPPSSPFGSVAAVHPVGSRGYRKNNGDLSPTFDQTFQSSMCVAHVRLLRIMSSYTSLFGRCPTYRNISVDETSDGASSDERQAEQHATHLAPPAHHSSPHAMDISPAPPARPRMPTASGRLEAGAVGAKSRTTSASSTSSSTSKNLFDTSFFAKLAANQPPVASAPESGGRTRIRSAELPLSAKTNNGQPQQAQAPSSFPLKRPMGLLRTASAKVNPFEVSPRPSLSVLGGKGLERASSDNHLLLGGFKAGREKRGLSGLGQENSSNSVTTLPGQRPSIAPYSLQGSGGSSGRRISGR